MNTAVAIHIASNALILIGHNPISDFNEDGAGARVAKNFYEPTVRALLQSYPWKFAKKKARLNRLVAKPLNSWEYQFEIPTDHIKTLTVNDHVDYEIFQDKIYCNDKDIDLDYIYRVDETYFTPMFREYVELYLAAKWAVPVTENAATMTNFMTMADNMRTKAKYDDAQSQTGSSVWQASALPVFVRRSRMGRR